ncbi:HD domain-containing protein [Motilibacter aurantiacus]|uniref:HD domain-containing protein n=1 Tax=Motilibacter aurantiacus TaxID=2714955 RepID=UPI00140B8CAB|nr:metal-dependent phosphohydrolase [Motilibacter aurantiacus]NHC46754.1 metal-dependent phosphohydrolase [Motilibacter aurantiacus]
MDTSGLPAAWRDVVRALGATAPDAYVEAAGQRLLSAYAEPHRAYHDTVHLAEVLTRLDELAVEAGDADVVRLAAWLHDAVYDLEPGAEERSALLAEEMLPGLGLPGTTVAEVARLVRLTTSHEPAPDDLDGSALADADLAVLAAPDARYRQYVAGVRAEYSRYDDVAFAHGRAEVLRALLARPALFRTRTGRQWEQAARANVDRELRELAAGG